VGRERRAADRDLCAPERRQRGLGAAALKLVEKRARAGGAKAVSLGVRPENAAALSLYRRAGYGDPRGFS